MKNKFLFILFLLGGTAMATPLSELANFRNTIADYKNIIMQGDEIGRVCAIVTEEIERMCQERPDNVALSDLLLAWNTLLAGKEDLNAEDVLKTLDTFPLNLDPNDTPVQTFSHNLSPAGDELKRENSEKAAAIMNAADPSQFDSSCERNDGLASYTNSIDDALEKIPNPEDLLTENNEFISFRELMFKKFTTNRKLLQECQNNEKASSIIEAALLTTGFFLKKHPSEKDLIDKWCLIAGETNPEMEDIWTLLEEISEDILCRDIYSTVPKDMIQTCIEALEEDMCKPNSAKELLSIGNFMEQIETFFRDCEYCDETYFEVVSLAEDWVDIVEDLSTSNEEVLHFFKEFMQRLPKESDSISANDDLRENFQIFMQDLHTLLQDPHSTKNLLNEDLVTQVESFLRKSKGPDIYSAYEEWSLLLTTDSPSNQEIVNALKGIREALCKDMFDPYLKLALVLFKDTPSKQEIVSALQKFREMLGLQRKIISMYNEILDKNMTESIVSENPAEGSPLKPQTLQPTILTEKVDDSVKDLEEGEKSAELASKPKNLIDSQRKDFLKELKKKMDAAHRIFDEISNAFDEKPRRKRTPREMEVNCS